MAQGPTAREVRAACAAQADPARAAAARRYFKTGPGDYGEGDRFLGLSVPKVRVLARRFRGLPLREAEALLESPVHEERLCALLVWDLQWGRASEEARAAIVASYLARSRFVNNWDLVDTSAPRLLGEWLVGRDRSLLARLARSPLLWERRIAILATFAFIRRGEARDALALAEALLHDEEDLLHKAVGWMLREVGGRVDLEALRGFLRAHAPRMPRTMLRYAIEKLPPEERQRWLAAREEAATGRRSPSRRPARRGRRAPG